MRSQTVFVVDDNPSLLKAMVDFLSSSKLKVEAFPSARAFLDSYSSSRQGCLLLDVRMPDMSGVELQELLLAKGFTLPIIIVSAHAVVTEAVKSMKLGCFDFIEIPYSPEFLLKRVFDALEQDRKTRMERATLAHSKRHFFGSPLVKRRF